MAPPVIYKPDLPELDLGDPINKGRVLSVPFYEGGGTTGHDITGNGTNFTTFEANAGWNTFGVTSAPGDTAEIKTASLTPGPVSAFPHTLRVRYREDTDDPKYYIMRMDIGGTGNYIWIYNPGASTIAARYSRSGGTVQLDSGVAPILGAWHDCVLVSHSTTDHRFYVDGVERVTSTSTILTFPGASDSKQYVIGDNRSAEGTDITVALVDHWDRALSPGEVARLYQEPYAGFSARSLRIAEHVIPARVEPAEAATTITANPTAQTLPSLSQSSTAAMAPSATAAQTLPSLSQSATAAMAPSATAAQTLPSLTQSATADEVFEASTTAQDLPSLSQSASASHSVNVSATASQTLPSLTQSATADETFEATTTAQTLPSLTQSAAADEAFEATTTAQTLPSLSQSAAADEVFEATTTAQTIPALTQSATADETFEATTVAQTLPSLSQSSTATAGDDVSATATQTLPSTTQSVTADETFEATTTAQTLPSTTQSSTASMVPEATVAQTFPSLSQSAAADEVFEASTTAQTLPSLSQSVQGAQEYSAQITQALPSLSQASVADQIFAASTAAQTLPSLTQSANTEIDYEVTALQGLPSLTQSIMASMRPSATVAQILPSLAEAAVATMTLPADSHETTMGELLGNIKNLLNNNISSGNSLYGIKTIKRGILPPRNQFPLITILPLRERIIKRMSNRRVAVARDVEIFLFTTTHRGKDDIYGIQTLADATLDLLRDNTLLVDQTDSRETTYWAEFSPIEIVDDDNTQEASFTATYYSYEDLPSRSFTGTQTDDVSPVTMVQQVYTKLNDAKTGTLSDVREVFREDWGTSKRLLLPSVSVALESQEQRKFWAGQDRLEENIDVRILSKVASASDQTIVSHLDILEPVKDLLQAEGDWTGRTMDSRIEGIDFGQRLENNEVLYETVIRLRSVGKHLVS